MIVVDSHIGFGAPHKQDTAAAHGEPLGADEIRLAKRSYGWPEDAQFLVPEGVREHFDDGIGKRGAKQRQDWPKLMAAYRTEYPKEGARARADAGRRDSRRLGCRAAEIRRRSQGHGEPRFVGQGAQRHCASTIPPSSAARPISRRRPRPASPSTARATSSPVPGGRNMHFGIREHAMGAVVNGMVLCGVRASGSTFLIFSDYMKTAIRLAALMELPVIHVFTHDSIGLGEDGPTHQPIEQLGGLRAIPGLVTLRPGDANEVVEAWRVIIGLKHRPVCLVLTRQALPTLDRKRYASAAGVARGAYVLADAKAGKPEVILMGTGSEVALCVEAYETLARDGVAARVVSMPSWELFEQQDAAYRDSVLPPAVTARVSVEAASPMGWDRYVGRDGAKIAMNGFGASAPAKDLFKRFGFTPEKVVAAAKEQIAKARKQTP